VEQFESPGAVVCHVPWQVDTASHPWTGFDPYSHSSPCGEQETLDVGSPTGHGDPLPPSEPPVLPLLPLPLLLAPLLLPLPLLLAPLLPPLPLLLAPLLLPPPPLLPLPLLLAPLLLPPFPPSVPMSVLNAVPPHASDIAASGITSDNLHDDLLMRTDKSEAHASAFTARISGFDAVERSAMGRKPVPSATCRSYRCCGVGHSGGGACHHRSPRVPPPPTSPGARFQTTDVQDCGLSNSD
jgi:hypothetical protein